MADSSGEADLPPGFIVSWIPTQLAPHTIKLPAADQVGNRIIVPRTMCFLLDSSVDQSILKQKIETAVASTAQEIPLLAGRVTWEDERRSRIQVVIPQDARVEVRFSNLPHLKALELDSEDWPPYKMKLSEQFMVDRGFQAVGNPCFALQANFMTGGLTLVFHMSHAVMDGTAISIAVAAFARHLSRLVDDSSTKFAEESREEVRDGSSATKLDALTQERTVDRDNGALRLEQSNPAKTHTIWRISQQKVEELCATYRKHDKPGTRTSTVNCISIFLWRTITKAWNLDPDSETTALWPVDIRNRVQPALGASYFGNALCGGKLVLKVQDLQNQSPNEIALEMQKSTNSWNDSTIRKYWASIDQHDDLATFKKKAQDTSRTFDCTSLLNIPCYGIHWGKGIYPRRWRFPPIGLRDGFAAILPRLSNGEGIEVSLHMYEENLRKILGDGMFRLYFTYCGGSSAWMADAASAALPVE